MKQGRSQHTPSQDWLTRYRVWRAGIGVRPARFAVPPEPRSIGSAEIGRQICDGQVLIAGRRVTLSGASIWTVSLPDGRSEADRHGFTWLDDLAAAGTREAASIARDWLSDWLDNFDKGRGPGWEPHVAARRLVRWVHHSEMLLDRLPATHDTQFRRAISRHLQYLLRHWRAAPPGLPTFETLCGSIIAGLALEGMEPKLRPGIKTLERMCREDIDPGGALASRNPEDLLELFALLVWSEAAMTEVGLVAQPQHRDAITRIAPTLRALRMADGGLARFHGGGRGIDGRLDSTLAAARVRAPARDGLAMGFARLSRGRATLVLDAASPPRPPHADTAHAATLSFELTVGRRPIIVNCGSGLAFGSDWLKASRATPAHSTLAPHGASSARLKPTRRGGASKLILTELPKDVRCDPAAPHGPASLSAAHDGFAHHFGLIHARHLNMGEDGLSLHGEDVLTAATEAEQRRFHAYMLQRAQRGIAFAIRFHLHPDVTAALNPEAGSVDLMLKSGELWVFRHSSNARMSLDPSVYLEKTRPQPNPTKQIVLECNAVEDVTTIRWNLARAQAQQTPVRDLYRDDMSIT